MKLKDLFSKGAEKAKALAQQLCVPGEGAPLSEFDVAIVLHVSAVNKEVVEQITEKLTTELLQWAPALLASQDLAKYIRVNAVKCKIKGRKKKKEAEEEK